MIGNGDEYIRKPSFLFWEDDGQNKTPMTPSTLSPASLYEMSSPLLNNRKRGMHNPIYSRMKERRNLVYMEGNSEAKGAISNITLCLNNDVGMLEWPDNINRNNNPTHDRSIMFNYNFYNGNADDMFQDENKIENREFQSQTISSKFLFEHEDKGDERSIECSNPRNLPCTDFPDEPQKMNDQIMNYFGNATSDSIYSVTDTVFKEMRIEESSGPKDISRYMDNEYLEILKTNLMLEFTKSRTCYLKLVPSVIEIFNIVRDAPNRCPIPMVQSIDDLGKERNIEEFENYFLNCASKQNSGFLAFCTEKRALKSGGGGKYYFFDKKLQLNGCHKVDVLNHHRQKNIMGPVFMKVLLFMFVVDPPYHLDPRARSSNPQRLMDFYYQLKSMNKLKSIKRLLKVWCMEMCPEEYLDAGYPFGSLLWVSTLDIESHIKKWRYRGKKSNEQFEPMNPTIQILGERTCRKGIIPGMTGFQNKGRNMNDETMLSSSRRMEEIHIQKRKSIENGYMNNLGVCHPDYTKNSALSEYKDPTLEVQPINQCSFFCKSPKKVRGRGRPKSKFKEVIPEEREVRHPKKKNFLTEGENNHLIIAEKYNEGSKYDSIEELEFEIGMELEQVSNLGYSSNFIWDLVRSIPVENLNKLYIRWLDGKIPGVTRLIVNSPVVHEYLKLQKYVENNHLEDSAPQAYNYKEGNSQLSNKKKTSGLLNPRKTVLYHKALYLAIQQHLLVYSSELQAILKALEGDCAIQDRDPENPDLYHKNLDVVINTIHPLHHPSMSFHGNSSLGMVVEDQVNGGEDISRVRRIANSTQEKMILSCDNQNNPDISRGNLVGNVGGGIMHSQSLSEAPGLGNNLHDSSGVFSIITSNQYQEYVELPDITSTLSDQLLEGSAEIPKNCANMGEPIDLFFAIP
ncbi:hypothetical protein OIY81_1999 [Cryptosporidium canis]|nr:hypothetical protein OIY81_1999 [Cryptosporidium canis]